MESFADQFRAFFLALGCHALVILLVWLGFDWLLPQREISAAGEPIRATLQVSAADLRRAEAAIEKAERERPAEEVARRRCQFSPPRCPAPIQAIGSGGAPALSSRLLPIRGRRSLPGR